VADTVTPVGVRVLPDGTVEGARIPAGVVMWTASPNLPAGYIYANGQDVSRAALPDLFAEIGIMYGAGDGVTTFNVPDLNNADRFPRGATAANLGTTGGTGSHSHAVDTNPHDHDLSGFTDATPGPPAGATRVAASANPADPWVQNVAHAHSLSALGSTDSQDPNGSTDSQANIPPFMRLRAIIKT
jgi:microcystin-dependent protein